jgi:hypothetical protein
VLRQLLQKGLCISFQLRRGFSYFLNQILVGKVLESIMDMAPLVMQLENSFGSLQKLFVRLRKTLFVLQLLGVFDDLVKHWLVLVKKRLWLCIVASVLNHVFNCFAFKLSFLIAFFPQKAGCVHFLSSCRFAIDLLYLLVKLFYVVSLGPNVLRHISFQLLHLHNGFCLRDLLEPVYIGVGMGVQGNTSQNSLLVSLFVNDFRDFSFHHLECLVFSVALSNKVSLLLEKDTGRVSHCHLTSFESPNWTKYRHILNFRILLVELFQQVKIISEALVLGTRQVLLAKISRKLVWREHPQLKTSQNKKEANLQDCILEKFSLLLGEPGRGVSSFFYAFLLWC